MTSTILTIVDEVDPARLNQLAAALQAARQPVPVSSDRLRPVRPNEAGHIFGEVPGLHFASVVLFNARLSGPGPLLVLELNFDGSVDEFLPILVERTGPTLAGFFSCCRGYRASNNDLDQLEPYLRRYLVRPGAFHIGNVGRSVPRIREEASLHEELQKRLDHRRKQASGFSSAEDAYQFLRAQIKDPSFRWVTAPHARQSLPERVLPRVRLWAVAAAAVASAVIAWFIVIPLAVALVLFLRFREILDRPMPIADLDPAYVRQLADAEDFGAQNHLASLTTVKPGLFRNLLLRVVLWGANLVARTSTQGKLGGIPSIHYAHWSLVDGGRRLLFLSNYGGSWESYLDDFIDKASVGLTGIWSNTVGFPKTRFLVLGGARDGVTFKAFARMSSATAALWYSAYPHLTVPEIQNFSDLREGLVKPVAGEKVRAWLQRW